VRLEYVPLPAKCAAVVEVPSCLRTGNTTDELGLTPPSHTGSPGLQG